MSTVKTKFIQSSAALFVACHYQQPDTDRAITFAEKLWDKLVARGYGTTSKSTPKERVSKNYYADLDPLQQRMFCLFWANFNHKHGRNNAAKRWGQLGSLAEPEYKVICEAAKAEAAKPLPSGQVRKMAEGWLSERRWEDSSPQPYAEKPQINPQREEIIELNGDLAHAKRQLSMTNDPDWQTEIGRIEAKLSEIQGR